METFVILIRVKFVSIATLKIFKNTMGLNQKIVSSDRFNKNVYIKSYKITEKLNMAVTIQLNTKFRKKLLLNYIHQCLINIFELFYKILNILLIDIDVLRF